MDLEIAIDELYATGWSAPDPTGCEHAPDGRAIPTPERVRQEFAADAAELTIEHIDRFGCYRAAWTGSTEGSVVGKSEAEAAIFALAQFRRQVVAAV